MMLDSSVLVAIALGEQGHLDLVDRILSAAGVRVAAPILVETLNFGDCLSYAAAATTNDSLLFVGNDFSQTDITPA
jgi:uncharacterized protein with PIN domain